MYNNIVLIEGNNVSIAVMDNHEIKFSVNGSYMRSEDYKTLPRIAITKWLIAEFLYLQEQYTWFWCTPFKSDGVDRESIYERLGFYQSEYYRVLEWGERPPGNWFE